MREVAARRAGDDTDLPVRKFSVGNINPGDVRCEFMQSVVGIITASESEEHGTKLDELIVKVHGPYLDVGRNMVVERFLKSDSEVLLFVDSDMEPTADQIHEIVAKVSAEQPIIGGLYVNLFPNHGVRPVALNWQALTDDQPIQMVPIPMPTGGEGLLEVDCVGTGFMAIHRSLLDQMTEVFDAPSPWFAEVALGGSQMGEDVTFCQRARSLGHPVYVDTTIHVPHHKTIRFAPEDHLAPTAQLEETPCPA